jgi:hypothetical protein
MNILLKSFILFCLVLVTYTTKAQNIAGTEYDQLILGVPNISEKNFDNIKNNLTSIPGVIVKYYCNEHTCFLILVDSNVQPDFNTILTTISNKFPKVKFNIKEGEFDSVTANCDTLIPYINTTDSGPTR